MVQVSDVIFCLKATNAVGQGPCATNILTAITPEYVPGLYTFSVIITLIDIEVSVEHKLTVDFDSPSGENVVHIDGILPVMESESNLPKEYRGMNIAMDWTNVNFKASGEHTIKICIDGSSIQEKKIYVKGKNE